MIKKISFIILIVIVKGYLFCNFLDIALAKTDNVNIGVEVLSGIPGPCSAVKSSVTADPTLLDVLNKSTIVVVLRDSYGNIISGHHISITSNQPDDIITFYADSNISDENGRVVAYLGTSSAHTSTITVKCLDDNVVLADKPQITFFYGFPLPQAKIVAPDRAEVNTEVVFDAQGSLGNLIRYVWKFGDDSMGNRVTEKHAFIKTGTFYVLLTVTDIYGRSDSATHKIDIVPNPPIITKIERKENELYFYGTSGVKNGQITLYIDADLLILTTKTDNFGNWVIVYTIDPEILFLGFHSAYATVTDENQMTSDASEKITFELKEKEVIIPPIPPEKTPLQKIIGSISDLIKNKVLTPKVIGITREIVPKTARPLASAAVGLSVVTVTLSLNLFNILAYILYAFNLLFELLGLKRKRNPWGVVYDAVTKKPVDLAIVRIFEKDKRKLLETRVTDKYGRFGFLVPPGQYYMTVTKAGYVYASKLIAPGTKQDDVYSNLYHGAVFEVTKEKSLINANIPIDPVQRKYRVATQFIKNMVIAIRVSIKKFVIPLLILSFILALLSYLFSNQTIDFLWAFLILLLLIREFIERAKYFRWGVVYDAVTKKPIMGAVVKIYDKEYNRLREFRVTDNFGRYGFLIPPGQYYLGVEKENYSFPSRLVKTKNDRGFTDIYHGEVLDKEYADSLISANIPLDPKIPN